MGVKNIISGFKKLLLNENEGISRERLKVCNKCEDRSGILCGICGCYLKAKTRDEEEKCPIGKW